MAEDNKLVPRENGSNGAVELISSQPRFVPFDLSPREPHLYDYLLILRKHQWLILSFLLAVVTIVSIATFRMQPVYSTTARIEIDRENSNVLPFQGAESFDYVMDSDNYIETESKILTSESLALQTIRSTGLASHPEYSSGDGPSEAIASGSLANHKRPPELATFLGSLSVHRVPNSRLLDVTFESTDPQLAARVVNAHIENFREDNFRSRYQAIAQASSWLSDQLDELKLKVQHSEDARIEYERKNQIWELDDKQNISTQRLSDINKELTGAQSERMKRQALYEFAKSGDANSVPELRSDIVLQELYKKRGDLNSQASDALAQYGPNFPKVQRLQGQLKEIDQLIGDEKKSIVDEMGNDYNAARQRELLLTQALDQQKIEANQMSERLVEYNILKREAEANKTLYDGMLTKLKEANIAGALKSSNIRVVDPAMIPSTPTRPAKARNIALAFIAQLGDSTLLIDADLRKPGVGRLLNMTDGKYAGLSSYLAGVSSLDLVTVPHPSIPNLAAIPTGPLPPNPADLLSSHKLADAITELRGKFKFIVIDSPPIMAATDAVILSVQVDGVLLVVRSGETPKEAFTRTRDLLISVKCRMLGVVLNAVDSSAPDYYYSYRYYPYSYGYGPQEAVDLPHFPEDDIHKMRKSGPSDDDDLTL